MSIHHLLDAGVTSQPAARFRCQSLDAAGRLPDACTMGGDSGRITVRERIDPELTATLFANYRSSADALMELIDNALDSRLPGQSMKVDVAYHGDAVTVMSEGGEDMGTKDHESRHLLWGHSAKRGRELTGQTGQGGIADIGILGTCF